MLFGLSVIGTYDAVADEHYPCKPAPDINTAWSKIQSMDKTYPVKRYLGPYTFNIPYGYFTGRQTPEEVNCHPKESSLEFAFWMPDLRFPKKDMWYDANFRPKEEGQAPPGPQDYIVKVISLKYIDEAAGESETPSVWFSNGLPSDEVVRLERQYDLLHVIPENPRLSEAYADLSKRDYKISLDCTSVRSGADNPSCKTYLYLTDLHLEALLLIPADALTDWKNVKDSVRSLVEQWRVK
ncbi:hypothetical protein Brsp01_27900 [Brucella sp. NBRC 12950]|nr:hypothetical protein Brsp01_27900 [Brucella sp. NBRC 12950]